MRLKRISSPSNALRRSASARSSSPRRRLSNAPKQRRSGGTRRGWWPDIFPTRRLFNSRRGWRLPENIGRVYDSSRAELSLGFRCETDFGGVLDALRAGGPLPFIHDPTYISPKERAEGG